MNVIELKTVERRKLEAFESASLQNLKREQIERIKRDPTLGTYPTARLVIAAFNRQEHALHQEQLERKVYTERKSRQRL